MSKGNISLTSTAIVATGTGAFDKGQIAHLQSTLTEEDVKYVSKLHTDVGALSTAEEALMQAIETVRKRIDASPDVQQLKKLQRQLKDLREQRREKNTKAAAIMEKGLQSYAPGKTLGEAVSESMPDIVPADRPRKGIAKGGRK